MNGPRLHRMLVVTVAACVVAVVGVAAYFIRRGPTFATSPRALSWSRAEADAGAFAVDAVWFGVEFARLAELEEPRSVRGALHRGDEWVVLDELNCFAQFVPVDGGVYVTGEHCALDVRPSVELLFLSSDGGVVSVASLPKPGYFALLRGLTVDGDTLRIALENHAEESLFPTRDEWVFPPFRVEPLTRFRPSSAPFVTITSKNRGLTWRMERSDEPP